MTKEEFTTLYTNLGGYGNELIINELAQATGWRDYTVTRKLKAYGLKWQKYAHLCKLSKFGHECVVATYRQLGVSGSARVFGVSKSAVDRYLRTHGVARTVKPLDGLSADTLRLMLAEHDGSVIALARQLKCSANGIKKRLRAYGIPSRSPSKAKYLHLTREECEAALRKYGSVSKAGAELGMAHTTAQRNFRRLGVIA